MVDVIRWSGSFLINICISLLLLLEFVWFDVSLLLLLQFVLFDVSLVLLLLQFVLLWKYWTDHWSVQLELAKGRHPRPAKPDYWKLDIFKEFNRTPKFSFTLSVICNLYQWCWKLCPANLILRVARNIVGEWNYDFLIGCVVMKNWACAFKIVLYLVPLVNLVQEFPVARNY